MHKVVVKVVVFLCGVVVAAWLVADFKKLNSKNPSTKINKKLESRNSLGIDSNRNTELYQLSEEFRNFISSLPVERQKALFQSALSEGSFNSVQKINSRILNSFPNYQNEILPELKKFALAQLLIRFRENDWIDWSVTYVANEGDPTIARRYVDLISLVNTELSNYLETSAYLLSSLYQRISSGEEFFLENEFQKLASSYEKQKNEQSAQFVLDASILRDQDFLVPLETQKRALILIYVRKNPQQLLTNLKLLLSLKAESLTLADSQLLEVMLRKFSLDASPKYRQQVFKVIDSSSRITEFANLNPGLRQAIAQLYVVSALDAIEIRDLRKANVYLDQSISVFPNMRSQEILADYIKFGYQNKEFSSTKINTEDEGFLSKAKNKLNSKMQHVYKRMIK